MPSENRGTVLAIDDDATQCLLIAERLGDCGYDVVTASTGGEGFDIATRIEPDIILLDVMLPIVDGFDVCLELSMHPLTAHVPVVLITGLKDPSAQREGLHAGAADFMTKPLDWHRLPQRLETVLDHCAFERSAV